MLNSTSRSLLFPEKKGKTVGLLRRRPTWPLDPQVSSLSRRRSKTRCPAPQKETISMPKLPRSGATGSGADMGNKHFIISQNRTVYVNSSPRSLLFPEKEAKSVVLLRRRNYCHAENSAKRSHGVWGWPQKQIWVISTSLFHKIEHFTLNSSPRSLLFPEKETKSVVLLRRRNYFRAQTSAKRSHGAWRWPQKHIGNKRLSSYQKSILHSTEVSYFPRKRSKKCCSELFPCPKPPRSGATGSGAGPRSIMHGR
jgi:hypothetical protein